MPQFTEIQVNRGISFYMFFSTNYRQCPIFCIHTKYGTQPIILGIIFLLYFFCEHTFRYAFISLHRWKEEEKQLKINEYEKRKSDNRYRNSNNSGRNCRSIRWQSCSLGSVLSRTGRGFDRSGGDISLLCMGRRRIACCWRWRHDGRSGYPCGFGTSRMDSGRNRYCNCRNCNLQGAQA